MKTATYMTAARSAIVIVITLTKIITALVVMPPIAFPVEENLEVKHQIDCTHILYNLRFDHCKPQQKVLTLNPA